MVQRLSSLWYDLKDSLWFIPAIMTACAVVLALVMVRLDQELFADRRLQSTWLFGGGAEGARGVLTAIAGTMMTVTATVFSITIVALQLASSQFTPRVLRSFTGDRGNQLVLGVFIATFTYALLVLRSVRSATEEQGLFVPAASVTLAIVLALISIGFLIFYVHHATRSIQAAMIIKRAADDTLRLIDGRAPAGGNDRGASVMRDDSVPATVPGQVAAEDGGYLQGLDEDALFALANAQALTIRQERGVGEFVLPSATLVSVWPASSLAGAIRTERGADIDLAAKIRGAFVFGPERTLEADVEFGIQQLADIAIRALSPGINDPTTAITCIDRLGEVLVSVARRAPPQAVRRGEDGAARLILRESPFERLVLVAFGQIRHYGAGDAAVAVHVATILGRMVDLVPLGYRPPLMREARLLVAEARTSIAVGEDLASVEAAAAWTSTA